MVKWMDAICEAKNKQGKSSSLSKPPTASQVGMPIDILAKQSSKQKMWDSGITHSKQT